MLALGQTVQHDFRTAAILPLGGLLQRQLGRHIQITNRFAVDVHMIDAREAGRSGNELQTVGAVSRHVHIPRHLGTVLEVADIPIAREHEVAPGTGIVALRICLGTVRQRGVLGFDGLQRATVFGVVQRSGNILMRRHHKLIACVAIDAGGGHVKRAIDELLIAQHVYHSRGCGDAVRTGVGVLTHLDIHALAKHRLVQSGHVHGDRNIRADLGGIVGAAVQHGGLAVLGVDSSHTLQVIYAIRMLTGHLDGLRAAQIAIPLVQPPTAVGRVGAGHIVVEVAGVVPVRGLRLHLGALEHAHPLDQLAGHGHVTQFAEFGDVDGTRRDAKFLFEAAVLVVVAAIVLQRAVAEFVPDDHIGQGVGSLGAFQQSLGAVRTPHTVAGPGDQRMVGGWLDAVHIGFLAGLVLIPHLLNRGVGIIPVGEELLVDIGAGIVAGSVPVAAIRLVERHEYNIVGVGGVGQNLVHHHFEHFVEVPAIVGCVVRVGAILRIIGIHVQLVGARIAGAFAAVVGPVRVPILKVDHQLLAAVVEELVLHRQHVGAGVLQTIGGLLRSYLHASAIEDGVRGRTLIAQAVQHAGRAAIEIAGRRAVINIQRLHWRILLRRRRADWHSYAKRQNNRRAGSQAYQPWHQPISGYTHSVYLPVPFFIETVADQYSMRFTRGLAI